MSLEQAIVPTAIRRRAAQHLESIRGTPMAPFADGARLSEEVWPIYRPDLEEIAYYEFTVDLRSGSRRLITSAAGLSSLLAAERDTTRAMLKKRSAAGAKIIRPRAIGGLGFIVAACGPHDFPIPHWSLERAPISAQLAAEAQEGGLAIERIFKIDSLAYVAESRDGSLVAQVGQMPVPVAGLPHDFSGARGEISSLLAKPARDVRTDDMAEGVEFEVKRDGEAPPELKPLEIDGWQAFRERYADSFGPYLDDLRRQAAPSWEIEGLIDEYGEGIHVGRAHRVALMRSEAVVEIGGAGASLVRGHIDESGDAAALVLEVPDGTRIDQEVELEIDIRYPDEVTEHLRFFLVSARTPSNRRVMPSEGAK
jgi:hypothetical protein